MVVLDVAQALVLLGVGLLAEPAVVGPDRVDHKLRGKMPPTVVFASPPRAHAGPPLELGQRLAREEERLAARLADRAVDAAAEAALVAALTIAVPR